MQGPSALESRLIRLESLVSRLADRVEEALAAAGRALQETTGGGGGFGFAPIFAAVGKVTTKITAKTSATVPGKGVATLYTDFNGTTLSGSATGWDVFNIANKAIKVDAVIIAVAIFGYWFAVAVDDCDNLE